MKNHFEFAIDHELKCIQLRLQQVLGYLQKVELLCRGVEYEEVLKKIEPIRCQVNFSMKEYEKIKSIAGKEGGV